MSEKNEMFFSKTHQKWQQWQKCTGYGIDSYYFYIETTKCLHILRNSLSNIQ